MPHLVVQPITNGHSTNGHSSNGNHSQPPFKKHDPIHEHLDGFSTRAIHIGSDADPATGAVIPPLTLSTTFKQDEVGVHKVRFYSILPIDLC